MRFFAEADSGMVETIPAAAGYVPFSEQTWGD
jgi:hypothetical protein